MDFRVLGVLIVADKALDGRADRSPEAVRNPRVRLGVLHLDIWNGVRQGRGTVDGDAINAIRRQRSETLEQRLFHVGVVFQMWI